MNRNINKKVHNQKKTYTQYTERKRERERETELFFYNTRIEVKAQMPVKQPVLDTNYKHLKII